MIKLNYKKIIALTTFVSGIISFFVWQNNNIVVSKHSYKNNRLPKEFKDFKILHLSDFHNKKFGRNHKRIIKKITDISPDIIVITGDLIDRRNYKPDISLDFIARIKKVAPVYYVSGNHEKWSGHYEEFISNLNSLNNSNDDLNSFNINILENKTLQYNINNSYINIVGVSDSGYLTENNKKISDTAVMEEYLSQFINNDDFNILLSHRPELINIYKENNMDIVFSGHTHGGQFRFPFIGGLVAPEQGFFPKYDAGRFDEYCSMTEKETTLFISRGLGNSSVPIRIFNRPEIIVVTIGSNL